MGALNTRDARDGQDVLLPNGLRMWDEGGGNAGPWSAAPLPLGLVALAAPDYSGVTGATRPWSMTTAGAIRVSDAGGALESSGNLDAINTNSAAIAASMGNLAAPPAGSLLALTILIEDWLDQINTRDAAQAASTAAVPIAGNLDHDAAAAAQDPVLFGGYASAAAPANVSADNDAVRAWFLRNGAQAVNLTAAGALIPGDATNGLQVNVKRVPNGEYETVAASQTDQILGATGAVGDYLSHLWIVPATTGPGAVSIKDGNGAAMTVFAGGTLPSVVPFPVQVGAYAVNGTTPGWKVTTGANVSVLGFGEFT